jgi:4,5-DOPA dioxygenase extradiol
MATAGPDLMPAAFIGHGSPMNALERNRYTETWASWGRSLPRPRAIVAVSAHWYIHAAAVTAMERPRTIHDFFGFPQALFDYEYPAPGSPELAKELVELADPEWVGFDHDSWGLDHGTWSVLAHAFPDADVPVVQLAINAMKPLAYHVELGARLAALRERGVLVFGSGNVVHNLGRVDFGLGETAYDWAERFDAAVRGIMTEHPGELAGVQEHADFTAAVPTADHFIPLLYVAGLADAAGQTADVLVDGAFGGSLTMTSYVLAGS